MRFVLLISVFLMAAKSFALDKQFSGPISCQTDWTNPLPFPDGQYEPNWWGYRAFKLGIESDNRKVTRLPWNGDRIQLNPGDKKARYFLDREFKGAIRVTYEYSNKLRISLFHFRLKKEIEVQAEQTRLEEVLPIAGNYAAGDILLSLQTFAAGEDLVYQVYSGHGNVGAMRAVCVPK